MAGLIAQNHRTSRTNSRILRNQTGLRQPEYGRWIVDLIYSAALIAVLIMLTGCESRVTPLIEAIDADNTVRIRELIARDPSLVNAQVLSKSQGPSRSPSARSGIVDRPLHYAAANGKLEIVNLLIELGAPVNETVIRGETALHRAARRAQTDVMKSLIENGAKVNARTVEGATPLHYAAKCGCRMGRHIQLLIEHKADREARTKKGQTPLHWAAEWSASTAVLALCSNGVNINVVDNNGRHVRDLLQENDRSQTTKVLRDNGRCQQLWTIYRKNKKVSAPELELAIRATDCDAGCSSDCIKAGILCRDGKLVAKDETRAVEYFSRVCKKRGKTGCSLLGLMVQEGRGIAKDEERAVKLFKQACDNGSSSGCNNLGLTYRKAKGVPRNVVKARSLYEMACGKGSAIGCSNLGSMLRDGIGGPKDKNRAIALFDEACKKGVESACKRLKKMSRALH